MTGVPSSTAIADVLALAGRPGAVSPPLVYIAGDAPVLGVAVTVHMAPGPGAEGGAFEPLYDLLSSDLCGSVVVVGGAAEVPDAVWGEILSRAAALAGADGVLIDAAVRDRQRLQREGVAVWGGPAATVGAVGAVHVEAISVPVTIGEVLIQPGDTVVMDEDGAVVLASRDAEEILDRARRYAEAEDQVLGALTAGETLSEAYRYKRAVRAELQ